MKISACMIVKDEEKTLGRCLESLKSWIDEIIIVDTGSTDNTVKIAESFGAKVYHEPWQNDFSLHRNQSIEKATGDWLFIIDADEEVPDPHGTAMRTLLSECPDEIGVISVELSNVYGEKKIVRSKMSSMRIFRRSINIRYEGFVHNRPVIRKATKFKLTAFKLLHYGYGLDDKEVMAKKFERMKSMCYDNMIKNPELPISYLYYAKAIKVKDGKFNEECTEEMREVLTKGRAACKGVNSVENEYIQILYLSAVVEYNSHNHRQAAIFAHEAQRLKPDYLDAIVMLGYSYTYGIDSGEGEKWFEKYLKLQRMQTIVPLNSLVTEYSNARAEIYTSLIDIEKRRDSLGPHHLANIYNDEQPAKYYDDIYNNGHNTDSYLPIYRNVVNKISENGSRVLEIGCGTGDLAKMIQAIPREYSGYDFSKEAIRTARRKGVKNVHFGNVYQPVTYRGDYNTLVALEVMEHVQDIEVLSLIPKGTKLILSVPNFEDVAHLRTYKDPDEIASRWQALVKIEKVDVFDMGGEKRTFLCHGEKIGV